MRQRTRAPRPNVITRRAPSPSPAPHHPRIAQDWPTDVVVTAAVNPGLSTWDAVALDASVAREHVREHVARAAAN